MDISPGAMVQAMVQDTLAGRSPLYRIKQFKTELLCVDGGVLLFGRNLEGNSSDKKSNNVILSRMSSIMSEHGLGPGAFVYEADSAMMTEKNLQVVEPNRFVTRLPANRQADILYDVHCDDRHYGCEDRPQKIAATCTTRKADGLS